MNGRFENNLLPNWWSMDAEYNWHNLVIVVISTPYKQPQLLKSWAHLSCQAIGNYD